MLLAEIFVIVVVGGGAAMVVISMVRWCASPEYRRRVNGIREGECPQCGYDRRGLQGVWAGVCPECGGRAMSAEPKTTDA